MPSQATNRTSHFRDEKCSDFWAWYKNRLYVMFSVPVCCMIPLRTVWESWGCSAWSSKKAQGDLIKVCNYLEGVHTEQGARLFLYKPSGRATDDGHTLKHRKFPTNSRKPLITVKKPWHGLPRKALETPSLKIFRSHHCPGHLVLGGPEWAGGRTRWPTEVPFSLSQSMVLSFCACLS